MLILMLWLGLASATSYHTIATIHLDTSQLSKWKFCDFHIDKKQTNCDKDWNCAYNVRNKTITMRSSRVTTEEIDGLMITANFKLQYITDPKIICSLVVRLSDCKNSNKQSNANYSCKCVVDIPDTPSNCDFDTILDPLVRAAKVTNNGNNYTVTFHDIDIPK